MRKLLSIVLILSLMFAIFAGCAKEPEAVAPSVNQSVEKSEPVDLAQGKTVAICMGSVSHPIHRVIQYGFLTKAEELGMNPVVSGLDDARINELISEWEKAVQNGAQGVLVWTGDDSCYDMMKEFKEQGVYCVVPHFAHDYETTKEFIDRNIAALQKTYCFDAADYIVERLTEKGITEGKIYATITGSGVVSPARDYFAERIEMLDVNYEVPRGIHEGFSEEEAYSRCTDYIKNTPGLVAVFGSTGFSPQCWDVAVENTGRTDLVIVGMDYSQLNLDVMRKGNISGLICQPFIPEAQESAQALHDLFNGEVFNDTEENWFKEMEAPIAYVGGEGVNNIEYYQNILDTVEAYFE